MTVIHGIPETKWRISNSQITDKNSGKIPRNLPQYVLEVATKIAELRQHKTMEIVTMTDHNARRLFRIAHDWNASTNS